jgi:hypothetical protein
MTQNGLWRSAIDLHPYELHESIETAKIVLSWAMGANVVFPPEQQADWMNVSTAWTGFEHALANYGAVLQQRLVGFFPYLADPKDSTWFAEQQRLIRAEGWSYSRPAWATDETVHTAHRQKLVNLRPDWYGPIFEMEKAG